MTCKFCKDIKYKIYEDCDIIGFLDSNPVTIGHTVLIPKKHYVILEETPDELISKMFTLSNKISEILFDVLKVQGTNTLINNGIDQETPHFSINIIPRKKGDKLNFEWNPIKVSNDQMDFLVYNIKNGFKNKKLKNFELEKKKIKKTNWIENIFNRIP